MIQYNIYFGTIGKTLGCQYRFTEYYSNEKEAMKAAYNGAASLYYKNEGKYGIPSFNTIAEESKLTGISVDKLTKEHINDMCRYYVIPTKMDTISTKNLIRW